MIKLFLAGTLSYQQLLSKYKSENTLDLLTQPIPPNPSSLFNTTITYDIPLDSPLSDTQFNSLCLSLNKTLSDLNIHPPTNPPPPHTIFLSREYGLSSIPMKPTHRKSIEQTTKQTPTHTRVVCWHAEQSMERNRYPTPQIKQVES